MPIDVESLLAEISPESPCGEDLTYEPEYLEVERLAQGTPAQWSGDQIVVEAVEPDWRAVRELTVALLGRTKDLRLLLHLSLALLGTEGLPGLRDGLALLRGVLEKYWDHVHPQLDPDDNNDPMERLNILASLSSPAEFQDPPPTFTALLNAPLCTSPILHRSYGLRDIRLARGEATPRSDEERVPDTVEIEAAFTGDKLSDKQRAELIESLQVVASAAQEAAQHVSAIDTILTERVGADQAPDLTEYYGMLAGAAGHVNEFLSRSGAAVGPAGQPAAAEAAESPATGAAAAGGPALSGEIRSTDDVIKALNKVCEYYARTEPSSPVPLLLHRAKRLVRKNFMEIIADLTPDSVRTIEMISGPQEVPRDEAQQY